MRLQDVVLLQVRGKTRQRNTLSQKLSHLTAMWDFDNEMSIWDSPSQVIVTFGDAFFVRQQTNLCSDRALMMIVGRLGNFVPAHRGSETDCSKRLRWSRHRETDARKQIRETTSVFSTDASNFLG